MSDVRLLVTGASGFVGGALVEALVARGHRVRTLQRTKGARLERLEREGHVENVLGSLDEREAVARAMDGIDSVFHVAAKAGVWGPYDDYFRANVLGTRHVIALAKEHGARRLVYTSSPSIVHAGGDQEGIDESTPIPSHHSTHYPATKAIAEREALAAHGAITARGHALSTVSLRPHLVWGPGDTNLAPRMIERAKSGRLVLVGGGHKRIDATFIESAVHAHLLAWERLTPDAACGGKAYFIAQGEPTPSRELILGIVRAHGLEVRPRSIPLPVAMAMGSLVELAWRAARRTDEPPLTRFLAEQLGTAHWYSLAAAERDLGYRAPVTTAEGLAKLAAHVKAG
ncbi:MAG: NAD-dependent epimerase/dehydratase family protein [Sandaracinaceae bacterium]|nr:NAD-dependent epimerase/dehydratase family protein [Sandaracinaceae bacterium]